MNDKAERLKEALRENLKRRKAHARERKAVEDDAKPGVADTGAGPRKEAPRKA